MSDRNYFYSRLYLKKPGFTQIFTGFYRIFSTRLEKKLTIENSHPRVKQQKSRNSSYLKTVFHVSSK